MTCNTVLKKGASMNRKTRAKNIFMFSIAIGMTVLLASCANQPTPTAYDTPGFFMGIVHGLLILLSFIGSIFMDIRMYAFPNSGVMYDFGFLFGAVIFLGVVSAR